MSSLSYTQVVPRLLREVPELVTTMSEHVRDNDEVLPHVFFGDLTRYVHSEVAHGRSDTVRRILIVLEMAVASQDQRTRDLVGVSFLENLQSDPTVFSALSALAGPEMKSALALERARRGLSPGKSK